jgi:hypothetical protein
MVIVASAAAAHDDEMHLVKLRRRKIFDVVLVRCKHLPALLNRPFPLLSRQLHSDRV